MNTMTLEAPRTTKAEVLLELIKKSMAFKTLSEQSMPVKQNGFRSRLTDLKDDGLNIQTMEVKDRNTHGRTRIRHEHYLYQDDIDIAVEMYNRINKK